MQRPGNGHAVASRRAGSAGMKMLSPVRAVRKPDRQGTGLAARIRSTPVPGDDPARAAGPAGLQPGGLAMTNQRQEKSRQPAACCVVTGFCLKMVGPPGVEPGTNGLCLPAMAFATPFGFVVWTVSCLYDLPVQSLHVLSCESFARDCHAARAAEVSPNLSSSTRKQSQLASGQPVFAPSVP